MTKVSTGAGLTGGDITSTGTVKANLLSETKLTNNSSAATEVSGRVYPVALDKSGKLAVNVPWTDTHGEVTSVAGKTGDVTLTNSDVGLGNVGNFKAVSTVASQGLTDTEKSNARSNIGAGTSNLTIGTTATTAMAGNKTFTTSIAADSGTNQLTLNPNTKYKLTAGGTSYVFTTPQDTTYSVATTSADGLMSSADKTKLNGIATGAEVNQNAFSNIAVSGQTTVAADSKTDTLTLVAGDNVTITTDATNDKVTIASTDTTYNAMSYSDIYSATSDSENTLSPSKIPFTFSAHSFLGKTIPESTDLDTLTEPSIRRCVSAAVCQTLSNCPITGSGFSLVILGTAVNGTPSSSPIQATNIYQILYPASNIGSEIWIRSKTSTGFNGWRCISAFALNMVTDYGITTKNMLDCMGFVNQSQIAYNETELGAEVEPADYVFSGIISSNSTTSEYSMITFYNSSGVACGTCNIKKNTNQVESATITITDYATKIRINCGTADSQTGSLSADSLQLCLPEYWRVSQEYSAYAPTTPQLYEMVKGSIYRDTELFNVLEYGFRKGLFGGFNAYAVISTEIELGTYDAYTVLPIKSGNYILGVNALAGTQYAPYTFTFYNKFDSVVGTVTITSSDIYNDYCAQKSITLSDDAVKVVGPWSNVASISFMIDPVVKNFLDILSQINGESYDPFEYASYYCGTPYAATVHEQLKKLTLDYAKNDSVKKLINDGSKNKLNLATGSTLDVTGYGIHCWIDPALGEIHLDGINDDKKCTGSFNIQISKPSLMGMVNGTVYHFSCDGYETNNNTIGLYVYTSGASPETQFDTFNKNELAWESEWNNDYGTYSAGFRLFIRQNTVVDNITLKPMVCEKAIYDVSSAFEPYGVKNNVLTPQAVDCVNSGVKNLLNCSVENLKADPINNGGTYGYTWVGNTCTSTRGASFTVNKDGSITVSASNTTGDMWFRLAQNFIFSAGTYIMNGCPAGGSTSTYMIESDFLNARDIGSGVTVQRNSEYSDNVYIVIRSGQTANLVFKPMICRKEKYAVSPIFEPHHTYDFSRRNLINCTSLKRDNSNYGTSVKTEGVRFTLNPDGTIIVNREDASSNTAWISLCVSGFNNLDIKGFCDGFHVLSGCPSGGSDSTYRLYAAKGSYSRYDTGTGVLLTSTSETGVTVVIAVYGGASASNLVFKPMICSIEDWRESTEFVPLIPDIQEVSQAVIKAIDDGAKNLCSTPSGSATAQWIDIPLVLDPGIYIMSVGNLASTDTDATTCQIGVFDTSWNNILGSYPQLERGLSVSKRLIISRKSAVLRIYSSDTSAHGSGDTLSFTNLMVCREADYNVSQKYEPYALPNTTLTPATIDAVNNGAKNFASINNTSATLYAKIPVNIPSGEYVVYFGNISSTDTDASVCKVSMFNSSGTEIWSSGFTRGAEKLTTATISQVASSVLVYASDTYAHSSGDTITISNFMICSKSDWNVSQEYEPYALPNPTLTPAVIETVDDGAKNRLPITITTLKSINTVGTWNGNTYTRRGISFTVNPDLTVSVSGTNDGSGDSWLDLYGNGTTNDFIGMICSGCPSGGSSTTYGQQCGNSNWDYGTANGRVCVQGPVAIVIRSGYNASSGLTFKPMICTKAEWDVSQTYEAPAFSNPTLTPAAIKAVNDGTKNLLVLTDTATTTTSGVTLTYYGDGTYKVNGTATADGYFYLARSDRNDVFRVGNVISGCTGGSSTTFYLTISATSLKQTSDPLTLTSNYSGSLLFSFKSGQTFSNKVIKPMVCTTQDWNISQEFEQYALPNPILTPAVVQCVNNGTSGSKNLLYLSVAAMKAINTSGTWNGNQYINQGITYTINSDGTITTSGTASSSANSVLNLYKFTSSSFLGNTYSFSGCPSGGDYNNSYALYVNRSPDNLISGSAETGNGVIFNVPSDALYYRILVRKSYNMSGKTFKPMICTVPDYNVSKDFVKFKGNTLIHDHIQVSLSSLTWTASASGLYYSNVVSVYGMSEIWMACLAGFASLRTTDNIMVGCRSSGSWSGFTLWANTNSFVSGAWVTVSVLGI